MMGISANPPDGVEIVAANEKCLVAERDAGETRAECDIFFGYPEYPPVALYPQAECASRISLCYSALYLEKSIVRKKGVCMKKYDNVAGSKRRAVIHLPRPAF